MRKNIFVGSIIMLFVLSLWVLSMRYYEEESSNNVYEDSIIGLSINGSVTTTFPSKESGLAIDSIICDKGASGVWDYSNWMLKVKNVSQNRTKCQVNFVSKYTESILNGTDPVLKEGLIPVEISDNGTVIRAKLRDSWYSYENQKWANAVILTNESKEYYEGEEISEDDIESYFVWIPRYKYQIFNMGNYTGLDEIINKVDMIQIKFGTETTDDTNESCKTPNKSGESGTCSIGKYMTHPAFLSFDVNGIWVGKFETGYKGAANAEEAQVNKIESDMIQIKPNVYSWRNIQLANAFYSSYGYKREMDSHMMKNTEWGAVAYLSHSVYGSAINSSTASVRINNNSSLLTGYGAVSEPECGYNVDYQDCNRYGSSKPGESTDVTKPWNTSVGVLASTTGNISGIYDMSGGAWESVMGIMLNSTNTELCAGREEGYTTGFRGVLCYKGNDIDGLPWPETKYYDVYAYCNVPNTDYNRRILGDATGEMGPFGINSQMTQVGSWHNDISSFIFYGGPWFYRGANYYRGNEAGVFSFYRREVNSYVELTYRVVLAF